VSAEAFRPTVLVVDDEEDVVAYLKTVLEDEGIDVLVANDSEAAVERLQERRPDLVVLDIMMPGHSGLALYRRIRADPATGGVNVIFLSACSAADAVTAMKDVSGTEAEAELVSYFEKPVVLGAFLDKVRSCLGIAAGAPASSSATQARG
jgi:CheY-like chemotaxis protein